MFIRCIIDVDQPSRGRAHTIAAIDLHQRVDSPPHIIA
jgi:hypothetical protein